MHLRPLTVMVLMLASSPAAAEDGAIRLFAPVPNGPTAMEQAPVEPLPAPDAIRLFSPVGASPEPQALAGQPAAPVIRGALREGVPADRGWTVATP